MTRYVLKPLQSSIGQNVVMATGEVDQKNMERLFFVLIIVQFLMYICLKYLWRALVQNEYYFVALSAQLASTRILFRL